MRLSKKRTAEILAKYSDVREALRTKEAMGARGYNKLIAERAKVNKKISLLSHQSKQTQDSILQLQDSRQDARDTIRKKIAIDRELKKVKEDKYNILFKLRTGRGFITTTEDKIVVVDKGDITEEEMSVLEDIQNNLESYSTGDYTIDRFYHVYGFDNITLDALRIFAKGEGLI